MALYHFNVIDGFTIPDPVGVELPDLRQARIQATRLAGDLLRYSTDRFLNDREWRLEITDEYGLILMTLYLTAIDAPAGQYLRTPNGG